MIPASYTENNLVEQILEEGIIIDAIISKKRFTSIFYVDNSFLTLETKQLHKEDVFKILEDSGLGVPSYYEWRSRSGCYFCFFA